MRGVPVMINPTETHASHCCYQHGCKYGNNDCPVAWGTIKQKFRCEYCDSSWEVNGKPSCCVDKCTQPGYWKWHGWQLMNYLTSVTVYIHLYFCDEHDELHRKEAKDFFARPIEKRIL